MSKSIINFYAPWCVPCKPITALVDQIIKDRPNITVVKVNIDKDAAVAETYDIGGIPTVLLNDGQGAETRLSGRSQEVIDFILEFAYGKGAIVA